MALHERWTFYDPLGLSTADSNGTQASISIPGGTKHDLWVGAMDAPRILQAPLNGNADFKIETKIDSPFTLGASGGGIVVQQDALNLIRFDVFKVASGATDRVFCASFTNGASSVKLATTETVSYPFYLKVSRVGNNWTYETSVDHITWTPRVTFSRTMTVTAVGLFAMTADGTSTPPPANTALFDYFRVDYVPDADVVLGGNIFESGNDIVSGNISTIVALGGNIQEYYFENRNDFVSGQLSVFVELYGAINEGYVDSVSGGITVFDLNPQEPETPPVEPSVILNLFITDRSRIRSGLDVNTQASKSFYREIRKFVETVKPWEEAITYETKPDEEWDLTRVSFRVYGRGDEHMAIMAAAGLHSSYQRLTQRRLILPTEQKLLQIKRDVGFESMAELRENFKPIWLDS